MKCRIRNAYLIEIALFGLLLTGCGGKHPAQVSGTVTMDGTPLPVGTVVFHPTGEGATAYGSIDKDGSYAVRSGTDQGLVLGEYVVTVVATTGPPPDGKLLTPTRYGNPKTSDLRCEVTAGSNRFDIALTGK